MRERGREQKRLNKCTEQQKNLYEAVQCSISHVLFKNVQKILFFNSFSHLPACIGQSEHIFAAVEFELVSAVDYRNDMEERKTNRQQTSNIKLKVSFICSMG